MGVLAHFFPCIFLYVSGSHKKVGQVFFWFYPPKKGNFYLSITIDKYTFFCFEEWPFLWVSSLQWKWNMIFQSETNPCFPKFESIELELEMPVSNENEILFHPKQILMAVSPNLSQCESWSPPCEAVVRHFVMKKSEPKWLHINIYVRGRANQSFPASFVPKKWLYQASTFFAPALRGRHEICQIFYTSIFSNI